MPIKKTPKIKLYQHDHKLVVKARRKGVIYNMFR